MDHEERILVVHQEDDLEESPVGGRTPDEKLVIGAHERIRGTGPAHDLLRLPRVHAVLRDVALVPIVPTEFQTSSRINYIRNCDESESHLHLLQGNARCVRAPGPRAARGPNGQNDSCARAGPRAGAWSAEFRKALHGALWCGVVYHAAMAGSEKPVRQSVSLPPALARRVQALAKRRRASANRVIVELIETGLEEREREKRTFFELADRLAHTSDPSEQSRLKEELARMTFGD